ncbi:iron complex transport system permease protein [Austwickia chelonae]|uniref:Putative ABC transporter permease protein n=1 Tax=Austwickia chelonae NBRC 105200 TaxID=1184607 RepID=K6V7U3_9MICO|nr:iron ABC transporter permease [Austwickia chelonae]GAB78298.1 putative ABC transporter permease protein [Austwickia chelonae NBRC 105200]SEW00725.1 iron complex transport system permease protein [Austwickia chelonae]
MTDLRATAHPPTPPPARPTEDRSVGASTAASRTTTVRRTGRRGRIPLLPTLLVLTLLTAGSVVLSLAFGSEHIGVDRVWEVVLAHLHGQSSTDTVADTIVWELRMPRALLALVVGAGLAVAGCGMQTLVRNPLADPYLLGISSGASVGATMVITLGVLSSWGSNALTVGALLGALGASISVYLVALGQGGLTPLRLVLSGVVLSSAFSAIASFLVFLSDDSRATTSVLFWLLGSLGGAKWAILAPPTVVVLLVLAAAVAVHGWLDALAAGEETACALGVLVGGLRTAVFLVLSILVGVLVSVSGGIGFVGLILPHLARILVGATHRRLVPVAALAGAFFLLWVDVLARMVAPPQEVPLGVVTGAIGAPLFLLLMGRRGYRFGEQS